MIIFLLIKKKLVDFILNNDYMNNEKSR